MNASTRLAKLAPITVTLLVLAGCDDDSYAESLDEIHVEFRNDDDGGDRDGPDKLNTSFLGNDEQLPFNNIPLVPGGEPNVELLEIRAETCMDSNGALLPLGEYTTLVTEAHENVPLDTNGSLGTISLTAVDDSTVYCIIEGTLWEDTYWEVQVTNDNDVIETDLWLRDVAADENDYPLYEWLVNRPRVDPEYGGEIEYIATCDEDVTNTADPALAFHAYLFKNLRVTATGDFGTAAGTMYVACRMGSVAKANQWRFTPSSGYHELASRVIRADYCADGNSRTQIGTMIRLWDDIPIYQHPGYSYLEEAAWSLSTGQATCLNTPRLPNGGQGLSCTLPQCNKSHLHDASIVSFTPSP